MQEWVVYTLLNTTNMKLKFIEINAKSKLLCTIGKTGQIRFKKYHVEKFDLKANTTFLIGYDEYEIPVKEILLVPSNDERAFKLYSQNSGYVINAKKVVEELKLNVPIICRLSALEKKDLNIENALCLTFL